MSSRSHFFKTPSNNMFFRTTLLTGNTWVIFSRLFVEVRRVRHQTWANVRVCFVHYIAGSTWTYGTSGRARTARLRSELQFQKTCMQIYALMNAYKNKYSHWQEVHFCGFVWNAHFPKRRPTRHVYCLIILNVCQLISSASILPFKKSLALD